MRHETTFELQRLSLDQAVLAAAEVFNDHAKLPPSYSAEEFLRRFDRSLYNDEGFSLHVPLLEGEREIGAFAMSGIARDKTMTISIDVENELWHRLYDDIVEYVAAKDAGG